DGGYAVYVGRLSAEKGIRTMLETWTRLGTQAPRLKIVGDGPLRDEVCRAAERVPSVEWLGYQSHERVIGLMRAARVLVFPSMCYEGLPLVITEAFATGLPVIASGLGGLSSVVRQEHTGLLVRPGDPADLPAAVGWVSAHSGEVRRL